MEYFYEWNLVSKSKAFKPFGNVFIHDETLRDGLQSPSATIPTAAQQAEILSVIAKLPIDSVTIGFPCVSETFYKHAFANAKFVVQEKYTYSVGMSARTLKQDIIPIVRIAHATGADIEVQLFIGSSNIKQLIEDWSLNQLCDYAATAVEFAKSHGLRVIFITEDTTRAHPNTIKQLYLHALAAGADRINVCDTAGYATPNGIFSLIRYIRSFLDEKGYEHIGIDFHGHMDRGLGLWNSIVALTAGADRIQACALGVGERSGNTPMEQLLVNLNMLKWINADLCKLNHYTQIISKYLQVPVPYNAPVVGHDAFMTSSGVHASAIVKALHQNQPELAEKVYTSFSASMLGRENIIRIGPMSGRWNVIAWLQENDYPINEELVNQILSAAKKSNRLFDDVELNDLVERYNIE